MQLVIAVIKPSKLGDVREALSEIGCQGMTITEVRGFGRQKGHTELYRGAEYRIDFLPKIRIDIAVTDDQLNAVVDTIQQTSYSGSTGDGKIFVIPLSHVVRIRTGEVDAEAI
ncbi:P-II family nitrogen regulator [Pseudidiomarina sp.]|uniref:P-II family nitrogen regulator n=1 Tax=Pseudidiomarina sp. TaxID=2081707 RepID=UPI00299DD7B8|nr:P-II family nitrogen regulator [Pseudidiomarina sp.]MDX1705584.1 P-II family nitrogen regulator [Pseudidiomarina sp.]